MPETTEIKVRTEDGCEQTFPITRKVKSAKKWAPARTRMEEAGSLSPGDYIDTARGWSSIEEIKQA